MPRVLVLALRQGTRTGAALAANLVRQLPRSEYTCAFLTAPGGETFARDLGYPALALTGDAPAALDRVLAGFGPDLILLADQPVPPVGAPGWAGPDLAAVRERTLLPVVRLAWPGTGQPVGPAGQCDLELRCAPPFAPGTADPGVAVVGLTGGGLRATARYAAPPTGPATGTPMIFLADPDGDGGEWAQPLHDQLAALDRPLRVTHLGPRDWSFPIADQLTYRHLLRLPPAMYRDQLLAADLYLGADPTALALAEAVLSGVPAVVWHPDAAGMLPTSGYLDCFHTADPGTPTDLPRALRTLLDDGPARLALYQRQRELREQVAQLPPLAEVLPAVVRR